MKYFKITGFCMAAIFVLSVAHAQTSGNPGKPNILLIMADDCTYNDLPVYGGTRVKTPNIDRLASQGMVFDRAYLSMSMCVPCRAELHTGMYPVSNGVCWNHSAAKPGVKGSGQYMRELGYRPGLAGKTHLNPPSVYQLEMIEGVERRAVATTAEFNADGMMAFMNRDGGQPFFLTVAFTMPHAPWTVGDSTRFDPEKIELPDYLADTKETRKAFCKYLAEIEELDRQTGLTLEALEKSGKADNTVVIFTSEQGAQWPGCKWTNWNTGVHTGFMVRWPGVVRPGTRTEALIQYADVLPTLIEMAGGRPAGDFDGTSFLPVLLAQSDKHRSYAYFMHSNIPEGPAYPIRAITDGDYHYIRNLAPEKVYIEKHMMGQLNTSQYWPSWMFQATENERSNALVNRYMLRPEEELYQLKNDPFNFHNLAGREDMTETKKRLSDALAKWMDEERDPGAKLDNWNDYNASKNGGR